LRVTRLAPLVFLSVAYRTFASGGSAECRGAAPTLHLHTLDAVRARRDPVEVAMSRPGADDPYQVYREAIRRRVCAVCLDGSDDAGCCGLVGSERCALEELLPRLVDAIRDVRLRRDDAFAAAVEARVCSHCSHRDAYGLCHPRRDGRCAVALYLPLVVAAIDEADLATASA
jgi:hypothetical protein